jgi:hypothetical protein
MQNFVTTLCLPVRNLQKDVPDYLKDRELFESATIDEFDVVSFQL